MGDWKIQRRLTFGAESDLRRSPYELARSAPCETKIELYDLRNDPCEHSDRSGDPAFETERDEMIGALDAWWGGLGIESQSALQEVEIDASVVERLRALGYVD